MPRTIRATAKQIQRSRANWYSFHYELRRKAMILLPEHVSTYLLTLEGIAPPQMTIFGGLPGDYPDRSAYELASRLNLDIHLMNPWYLTDQGWDTFQALWQQLPEPVDLYMEQAVQVGTLILTTLEQADLHR